MSGKVSATLKDAKRRCDEKCAKGRDERHARWANRFPFNMIHDMWRGITGEPRN